MKELSWALVFLMTSFDESMAELIVGDRSTTSIIPECVLQVISSYFNTIVKMSVRHKTEQETEVTELFRKTEIPVIINTDEIPKRRGLEKRRANQVELFMDDSMNITDKLMRTLWIAETQFIMILRDSPNVYNRILHVFNQFSSHNVVNIIVLVDKKDEVFTYGFSPYQNCKSQVDELLLLSICSSGNFRKVGIEEVAPGKSVSNLKGCPINVTVVDLPPAVIFLDKSERNGTFIVHGIEGKALIEISRKMNFVPKFAVATDGQAWGWIEPEPHGAVGEVFTGLSDFGFGLLATTMERYECLDLSIPINAAQECVTWAVPVQAGKRQETWINILVNEFPKIVWYFIACVAILVTITFRMFVKFSEADRLKLDSYLHSFFFVISSFFGVPVKIPTTLPLRILFSSWVWYCFILLVAYQSSMGSKLTVPTHQPDVNTFGELLNSDLQLTGKYNTFRLLQYEEHEYVLKSIAHRLKASEYGINEAIRLIAHDKNIAYMSAMTPFIYNSIIDLDTRGTVHVMKECVYIYYPSMVLKKRSPLTSRVNFILRKLFEAGIIKKWRTDYVYKVPQSPPSVVKLSLNHMIGPFFTICVGNLLSVISFMVEIIYFSFLSKSRH